MFVGHYAPALVGKAASKNVKLWHVFVAAQLVDFAWAALILLDIEKARIVPGFLAASPLDLYHMPYTHSLIATALWMAAGGAAYRFLKPSAGWWGAIIIALVIGSHWLTDLIVHTKDLPLLLDGPKVGFGLWENLVLSQAIEIGTLAIGLAFYIGATRPKSVIGKVSPYLLFGFLVALQVYNHAAPAPTDIKQMAMLAFISFSLIAAMAALVDLTRE